MQSQPSDAAGLVWVTRAQPGADATARRLREGGWSPLVAPLIATRPLPLPPGSLEGADALGFTSAAGVRAFDGAGHLDLPVFTVGDATAEAARAAGFTDVRSAKGAGADLARLIAGSAAITRLAHLGARYLAFDLTETLRQAGVTAVHVPVYEAVVQPPSPLATAALAEGRVEAVLIHSPAAARALAASGAADRLHGVRLVALSGACAQPLEGLSLRERSIARAPTEAALLDALGNPPAQS